MPVEKLREFLDRNRIKYVVISHSPAHTAQEIAASAHIPGRNMAKTVIVKLDGRLAMAVLPASELVDLELLADAAFAQRAELADEEEFEDRFPDCQLGAMPPFGNL
jgi:Ala-tRNA(Pro) deacylase